MKFRDITGQRFARLVAISPTPAPAHLVRRGFHWVCHCDCGNTITVASVNLRTDGRGTRSCGCVRKETVARAKTHRRPPAKVDT
jgi:hypothetical protein